MRQILSKFILSLFFVYSTSILASEGFSKQDLYGRQEARKFKIILIGATSVGKTALLVRYAEDTFSPQSQATLGIDFRMVRFKINTKMVHFNIWDTAGHERFRAITKAYYRGAQGIFLVYDICNRDSFERLKTEWLPLITENADPDIHPILFIIGNKSDLDDQENSSRCVRAVTSQEGLAFAKDNDAQYYETSAKNGTNVARIFEQMGKKLLELPFDKSAALGGRKAGRKIHSGKEEGDFSCCTIQ